jgi:hypothetical protein
MYKDIAARSATMSSQIAAIWTVLRDPERSLDAAIEAFNKAMESGSSSWADALSGMNNALQFAIRNQTRVSDGVLGKVQLILETKQIEGDSRLAALKETLKSYREKLSHPVP